MNRIDISKVQAAVTKYAPKRIDVKSPPVKAPPVDAALRKTLKSHGRPCSGFMCSHFLNREP